MLSRWRFVKYSRNDSSDMSYELPPTRHLGNPSISQALEHRSVELNRESRERVREAVNDVQEVLEAKIRPRYEAGEDGFEEVYVAEDLYQRGVNPPKTVRDAIFDQAGVTDKRVREAVQYTHKAEARRTHQYGGSKDVFVLVDEPHVSSSV